MKKLILLFCCMFLLIACRKEDTSSVVSGTYVMEVEQENKEEILFPLFSIDTEKNEFSFCYDILSSYVPIGTYEIKENLLTATTNDNQYHYVFKIVDNNTLSFVEEASSEIKVVDTNLSVVPQDGTIFKKIEKSGL